LRTDLESLIGKLIEKDENKEIFPMHFSSSQARFPASKIVRLTDAKFSTKGWTSPKIVPFAAA
jgi:hypothetical protein